MSSRFPALNRPALNRPALNRPARTPRALTPLTLATAGAAGLFLALAAPLSASAHVTVGPDTAEPGSYSIIDIRVPNESATATTVSVEVQLPTDTPFASVSYIPVPGWTAQIVETALPEPVTVGDVEVTQAVTSVIWTADPGSEIQAGQLQVFPLSVGPVPDVGSIQLPAIQTYSDGDVVEWTGDSEAEEPAPVLYVNDAPVGHSHADADEDPDAATAAAGSTDTAAASAAASADDDVLARILGIGGLVLGAIAVVLASTARGRVKS